MATVALETYLRPIGPYLNDERVTELSINEPGRIFVESDEGTECIDVPELDYEHLEGFAELVAEHNNQAINGVRPLLSGELPGGFRIQLVRPPACEDKKIICSVRRHRLLDLNLAEYASMGAFDRVRRTSLTEASKEDKRLAALYAEGDYNLFLRYAIRQKKNLLVSGGVYTGKTTLLNACLKEIPESERIITIEDTRELRLSQRNRVHLLYARGKGQGVSEHGADELVEATLRLRPDRIILGELRGSEAFSYLQAINTGHPGSIASIHANSPALCFERVALMVMQARAGLTKGEIEEYVRLVVDVVVQVQRSDSGKRFISEMYYAQS